MAMIRASALAIARAAARPAVAAVPVRCMTTMHDRERALEQAYFNREEERLLRKLLGKVKTQVDTSDKASQAAASSTERQALERIIGKYNVSEEDKAALISWRHSAEY